MSKQTFTPQSAMRVVLDIAVLDLLIQILS